MSAPFFMYGYVHLCTVMYTKKGYRGYTQQTPGPRKSLIYQGSQPPRSSQLTSGIYTYTYTYTYSDQKGVSRI